MVIIRRCAAVPRRRNRNRGTSADVLAIWKTGTYTDAYAEASRANGDDRGLPIKKVDKRHRVEQLLKQPEREAMSQERIGEICNVAQQFVSYVKLHMKATSIG